jgi:predicted nucleic acid-binding protein
VVDNSWQIVVDSSPLIYLAKLQALDVFEIAGAAPLVPAAVMTEVATPALAYVHRDAQSILAAAEAGKIGTIELSRAEQAVAERHLAESGLGIGESHVLAVAEKRGLPAAIFERRGRNVARRMGVRVVDIVELLFDGTPEDDLLEDRIRRLASVVDMRVADYEAIGLRIKKRRLR